MERERDEARDQRDAITLRLGQTQEHLVDARRSAEQWRAVAAKYAGCTENECNRLPWEAPWDDSLHNWQDGYDEEAKSNCERGDA